MTTAVSAPGKVFLAGGYLVLDRAYTALVFGLSARIHVLIDDVEGSGSEISVLSPQFLDAEWKYGFEVAADGGGIKVEQLKGSTPSSRNPFVETTLTYTLTYIFSLLSTHTTSAILIGQPIKITIIADNSYYSHAPSNSSSRFSKYDVSLSNAHKTGLGSSAALVTSLTLALLTHYLIEFNTVPLPDTERKILHNLAQAAHCAAQGKVGSGFDIAAAVYGTHLYRRFSPSVLSSLPEANSASFASALKDCVEDDPKVWDTEIDEKRVKLPDGYSLVMCDVDCGSSTVSMVKSVLAWKAKESVAAKNLWDEMQMCNEILLDRLSSSTPDMLEISRAFKTIRANIREMGEKSGVPIEPPEQTKLLDAVGEVEGVVGGVVPGAGGYDAIVLLVKDDEETTDRLEKFLEKWSKETGGNVKLLGAKGELEGARVEENIEGLYGELVK